MAGTDIRDRTNIGHQDVAELNFVRPGCRFVFRRHFRQGLRSHVMEVLNPQDVARESRGVLSGGLRRFPDARPVKMLRIFKAGFSAANQALEEIRRLRVVEDYLPPDLLARSEEFLVTYRVKGENRLLLCGLQEYVRGKILDPWSLVSPGVAPAAGVGVRHARRFVSGAKRLVMEAGYIPDLAGIGNLFAAPDGRIKLVDINNISRIPNQARICLDDRGYPACDKSIEALFLIERHLCDAGPQDLSGPPYDRFLAPERKQRVRELEEKFFESLRAGQRL